MSDDTANGYIPPTTYTATSYLSFAQATGDFVFLLSRIFIFYLCPWFPGAFPWIPPQRHVDLDTQMKLFESARLASKGVMSITT